MLRNSIKIIVFSVILSLGLSLFTETIANYAKSQNEVWNFYNNQLYGGAVYQVVANSLYNEWFCTVNKNSLYSKKLINDYWEKIPLPQTNTYIQYIYPYGSSVLLVADQGMYHYIDQGIQEGIWEEFESPKAFKTVEIIETELPTIGNIFWMATSNGLYYSKDPSSYNDLLFHWSLTNFNTAIEIKDLWYDATTNTFFVLSADSWLYMTSEPELITFLQWNSMRLDRQIHDVQQFISAQDSQKTWIISTQSQGLYISKNNGETWENISKEMPNLYVSQMSLIKSDVYTATYGGLWVFHLDNGLWSKIGDALFNEQINCFAVVEYNRQIIIGTNGNGNWTIQNTSENAKWVKDDRKMEGILVKKIIKNHLENKMVLSTWGAGIYLSNNNGINWKQSNQGLTNPYILSLYYESDEKIWAGTLNGGLFLSRDFGESWNQVKSSTLLSKYIYSILVDRNNSNVMYAGTDKTIFKSINQGESWNKLDLGTEDMPVGNILTLAQDWTNTDMIYAGTDSSGVYISKDGGQSWFPSQNGLPYKTINHIVTITHKKNIVIASTDGDGCYLSLNQGNTWERIEGPEKGSMVYDIYYSFEKEHIDECFVSTEKGIYRLNLVTWEWAPIGINLLQTSIRTSLVYQQQIWIGTYGKGVARLVNLPNPPMPMEPPNFTQTTKTRIMFRWSETSFSEMPVLYQVQIASDQNFKEVIYLSSTISGDQWLTPENVLKRHKTYYWRVRGETILGNTEWSKAYQFTIVTIIQMQINQSQIEINGQIQALDSNTKVVPVIKNNRTFLPIRVIIEAWEGTIGWENQTKLVTIRVNGNTIQLTINQSIALVNGVKKTIDENKNVVPFIFNGRTMLPLRFIAENLQSQVDWDPSTQRITLVYPAGRST